MSGTLTKMILFGRRRQPALAGFRLLPLALAGGLRTAAKSLSRLQPGFSIVASAMLSGRQGLKPPLGSPAKAGCQMNEWCWPHHQLKLVAKAGSRLKSAPHRRRASPHVARRTRHATGRRGFTLVELLVVIFIMLLITAVTIPVIAPSVKNRDVREAARMIDVFINGARSRAKLNGHIYGVMLERMPGMPNGVVALSYCEQPDTYTGDYASAASFPGMGGGGGGSTIRMLGNGGFGGWLTQFPPVVDPIVFPMSDAGWIAGPAPTGGGYVTNIAPGDVVTVKGVQYRIWAGEPFLDLDQSGYCNVTGGFSPNTPIGITEPFVDVDGNGTWTPPNPPPGQTGVGFNGVPFPNVPGQPYVDLSSGYFVQTAAAAPLGPFPAIGYATGAPSAFITYAPFDPAQAAQVIGAAYQNTVKAPGTPYYYPNAVPSVDGDPKTQAGQPFSFLRRPVKTSAPSIQLPGQAVIDLGANYFYPGQPAGTPNIVAIPGSGIEVLVANANAYGWWSTFRPNPALDPTLQGTAASLPPGSAGYLPPDPTSIMITFQPNGTVDRVFSWSEANDSNATLTAVNWSDWQGRIPAGPIYLLVGRQELLNGDPTMVPLMAEMAANSQPPLKPIYNVQDPDALWVVIDPRSGSVATAENVGYDLSSPMILTGGASFGTPFDQMSVYWAANVYYTRRIARDMLDKGGR